MSLPSRGLDAMLYLGGVAVALLKEVEFEGGRPFLEKVELGSLNTSNVLLGIRHYKGKFKKAYVDRTYLDYFEGGSLLVTSIAPTHTSYITGQIIIVACRLLNMAAEQTEAVEYEGDFLMFGVDIGG